MILGDETHFLRKREVEIQHSSTRTISDLIVNISVRADEPPGMRSIYLFKLLIHLAQYREVATAQVLELKYERVNEYFPLISKLFILSGFGGRVKTLENHLFQSGGYLLSTYRPSQQQHC